MKNAAILLIPVLILVGGLNVALARHDDPGRFHPATLGDRVAAACAPMRVSDWHVDYTDPTLLQVECYDAKSSSIRSTVVER